MSGIISDKCFEWWENLSETTKEIVFRKAKAYWAKQDYNFKDQYISIMDKYNMWINYSSEYET